MKKNKGDILLFLMIFILLITFGEIGSTQYKNWKSISDKPKDIKGYWCVFATRIGLVGSKTYTGHLIKKDDIFVALPHYETMHKWVEVRYKDKIIITQVKDVGPWSTLDKYWKYNRRPLAESKQRLPKEWETKYRKPTNPAGIDLSDGLVKALGINKARTGVWVFWRFIDIDKTIK